MHFWGMKISCSLVLLTLFVFNAQHVVGQKTWMGKRLTNTAMFMDPTEVQFSGSINGLLNEDINENQYLPFNIGASQSIYAKSLSENKAWEIMGELGAFTQFEWIEVDGSQQRNLLNTDYKIAFSYVRKLSEKTTYRLRFFHVSSHLGDDFIIRNSIRKFSENKVNYEQLEFTYYKYLGSKFRFYGGIGAVVRPDSEREPLSYHFGSQLNLNKESKKWGWSFGYMVKGFQETDFQPNLKVGFGPAYYTESKEEPVRFVIEYYTGHLPYSQFEQNHIDWLGLGLYFYI